MTHALYPIFQKSKEMDCKWSQICQRPPSLAPRRRQRHQDKWVCHIFKNTHSREIDWEWSQI